MLVNCLYSLKRKFFAIGDHSAEEDTVTDSELCSPRKRLRMLEPTSIDEANYPHALAADDGAPQEEGNDLPLVVVNRKRMEEELEASLKELREDFQRVKKEAEHLAAKLEKIKEEDLECIVCRDMVQNPQLITCGHTACYTCLRNWWTQPPPQDEPAELIDTEAEDDINEEPVVLHQPNAEGGEPGPEQVPRPRRRHIFFSAVYRKKRCPYCSQEVRRRPVPNLQLRTITETVTKDLPEPLRRMRPSTRRPDLWHGIFHPEHAENALFNPHRYMPPLHDPGPPPPPHPDPILNEIAQAQYRRAVEEAVARRERGYAEAFENGRAVGRAEVQRRWDRDRAERAPQPIINGELRAQGLVLAAGDALPVPQEAPGGDVPHIMQIHPEPIPGLRNPNIVPPEPPV